MLDRLEVPSEPASRRNPNRSPQFGVPHPGSPKVRVLIRMRKTTRELHTGAANRPVCTTKPLVRETLATNVGTIRAEQGISVGKVSRQ